MSQSLERKPVSTPRLVHMGPGGGHRRTPPSPEMLSRDDEQHIMGATSALISALWSVRAIDRTIELPMIELPYQVPSESEQLQFGIGPKDAWFLLTTTSLWLYAHAAFAGNIGRPLARRCGLTSFEHQQLFGMHLFNTIHCLALTVFAWLYMPRPSLVDLTSGWFLWVSEAPSTSIVPIHVKLFFMVQLGFHISRSIEILFSKRPGTKLLRFAWNAVLALALFLSLLVGKIKLCYLIACLVNVELLAFSLLGCLRMLSDAKLLVVALLVALTVTDAIVSSVVSLALGSVALMSPGHLSGQGRESPLPEDLGSILTARRVFTFSLGILAILAHIRLAIASRTLFFTIRHRPDEGRRTSVAECQSGQVAPEI